MNNLIKTGNKVHFISNELFTQSFVTATIIRVNKKSVKARKYAGSGWNSDRDYLVKLDDIMAIIDNTGTIYKTNITTR